MREEINDQISEKSSENLRIVAEYLNKKVAEKFPGVSFDLKGFSEAGPDDADGSDRYTASFKFATPQVAEAISKAEVDLEERLEAVKVAKGEKNITVWSYYPVSDEHDKISGAAYDAKQNAFEEARRFVQDVQSEILIVIVEEGLARKPDETLLGQAIFNGTDGSTMRSNPDATLELTFNDKGIEAAASKVQELSKGELSAVADNPGAKPIGKGADIAVGNAKR